RSFRRSHDGQTARITIHIIRGVTVNGTPASAESAPRNAAMSLYIGRGSEVPGLTLVAITIAPSSAVVPISSLHPESQHTGSTTNGCTAKIAAVDAATAGLAPIRVIKRKAKKTLAR